jgi:competence protein ComEC
VIVVIVIATQVGAPIAQPTPSVALAADVKLGQLSGASIPEYVLIQNTGTAPQDLSGWYLESTIGPQTYNFPIGFTLAPGTAVRIESYTGAANNPPATLLWSTDPIWRNAGDKAVLRNRAGAAISTLCFGDACP